MRGGEKRGGKEGVKGVERKGKDRKSRRFEKENEKEKGRN